MDLFSYVGMGSVISLVALCVRLAHNSNGKMKEYVHRPECHSAQKGIHNRINDLDRNLDRRFQDIDKSLDRRFEDMKAFIKNGNK